MAVKVAINGFGRIGRLAFRQMFGAEGYEVNALMYTVLLFILYNHISFLLLTLRETRLNLNGFFMEIYMIFRYSSLRINL